MSTITIGQESTTELKTKNIPKLIIQLIYLKEIISIVGIVIHEISHYIFCKLLGLEIYQWSLFTINKDTGLKDKSGVCFGYFTYEKPDTYKQELLVNIAPLLINTVIGLSLLSLMPIENVPIYMNGVFTFIILSIFAKAIPSIGDINNIEKYRTDNIGVSYVIIIYPLKKLSMNSLYFVDYIFAGLVYTGAILYIV